VNSDNWLPSQEQRDQIVLSCQELTEVLPTSSKFLFVEWGVWGPGQIVAGCRQIPFLEKTGKYWGRPLDSVSAIQELERLRLEGASHIVFAWPAFWWLDYYAEFHSYLRAAFRCALQNDRLVVFDLRKD